MKTGQPIIGRPAWYDRNPTQQINAYSGVALAPHASTSRLSYTVPAGKKAMVEALYCGVFRVSAATTAGIVQDTWFLTKSGGTGVMVLRARMRKNSVADQDSVNLGTTLLLLAGDIIELLTYDDSTGGTVDHQGAIKITEFDA